MAVAYSPSWEIETRELETFALAAVSAVRPENSKCGCNLPSARIKDNTHAHMQTRHESVTHSCQEMMGKKGGGLTWFNGGDLSAWQTSTTKGLLCGFFNSPSRCEISNGGI